MQEKPTAPTIWAVIVAAAATLVEGAVWLFSRVAQVEDFGEKARSVRMAKNKTEKIGIENVNHPGHVTSVDAGMYEAMKRAFLKILPKTSPGLTADEVREKVIPYLPEDLFPGGAKAGWWTKAVQLDLEAKGIIAREKTRPLRWRKV